MEVRRGAPPRRQDGWYGQIAIRVTCRTPVHVGWGAPRLVQLEGKPTLVEGFSTLTSGGRGRLVIPGSSVKGGVRAIVEALTPSCERTAKGACNGRGPLCPSCALLGAPGWRACVSFSDLAPIEGGHSVAAKRIAQRYSHRNALARGRRLYQPRPESPQPVDTETLLVLKPGSQLVGEVAAMGATEADLGVLTIALGLPPHGLPYLRLGGGKNRGLGVLTVEITSVRGSWGWDRILWPSAAPLETVTSWQQQALAGFPELKDRVYLIRSNYEES